MQSLQFSLKKFATVTQASLSQSSGVKEFSTYLSTHARIERLDSSPLGDLECSGARTWHLKSCQFSHFKSFEVSRVATRSETVLPVFGFVDISDGNET